ncbi:transmembrane protein [Mycobacterium lentiflavum]|uniref:Transmembrane protein n=1 Tax=Mycobacterium lentiflavum TaxID=141349 RepID=A0A0E4GXI3_MYCLN|nr:hypothetical protein [Mycobacterium lentiflavum]CQD11973.1 transmembrane protein [Mycobacterium lentiflavum]
MTPTLSQLQAWDTDHLINAATYWTQTANQWEDTFITVRNQSNTMGWEGQGGDALRRRTGADLATVSTKADHLRNAAQIARTGASNISAAQRQALYAVEDAQNAGFEVGEDLSVTDTHYYTDPAQQAARQAQADMFATNINQRAAQLLGVEADTSGQLTAAGGEVGAMSFAPAGGQGGGAGNGNPLNGTQSRDPVVTSPADRIVDGPKPNTPTIRLVDDTQTPPGQPQIGPIPVPPQVAASVPPGPPPAPPPPRDPTGGLLTPQNLPPASPPPNIPGATPLPGPGAATAAGPAGAAGAVKPPCSPYDATKAALEPVGGMIAILTAAPEGATGVGIPAAIGQIALGTAAVADGLDAAGKCLGD